MSEVNVAQSYEITEGVTSSGRRKLTAIIADRTMIAGFIKFDDSWSFVAYLGLRDATDAASPDLRAYAESDARAALDMITRLYVAARVTA